MLNRIKLRPNGQVYDAGSGGDVVDLLFYPSALTLLV